MESSSRTPHDSKQVSSVSERCCLKRKETQNAGLQQLLLLYNVGRMANRGLINPTVRCTTLSTCDGLNKHSPDLFRVLISP